MKLLYATSIIFPSGLANRLQILATFEAMYRQDPECILGVSAFSGERKFPIASFKGSKKSPLLGLRYARYMQRHRITRLYCREDYLLFFIILWSKLLGTKAKYYFEAHKLHDGWAFPLILKWVDGIVSITHGLKEDLIKLGVSGERIIIAPDAVDVKRFDTLPPKEVLRKELGLPADKKVIAYAGGFGGLHPWKGADVLLDAALLADDSMQFVLAGGRPDELKDFSQRYRKENITIQGGLSPEMVARLLVAADVLVIPNKGGYAISERHTSPMKLFEYMASGTPILASDLPSIREVVNEEDVQFFEPNNPQVLLEGLHTIIDNQSAASERARHAWQKVQSCTWDKRAQHILAFLRQEG